MNRKAVALLMPLATTGITILIIVAIGTLLLEVRYFADHVLHLGHEGSKLPPVAAALAVSGAILVGCALAARGGQSSGGH